MRHIINFLTELVGSTWFVPTLLGFGCTLLLILALYIGIAPLSNPKKALELTDKWMRWLPWLADRIQGSKYRRYSLEQVEKTEKKYIKYTDENLYVRKK